VLIASRLAATLALNLDPDVHGRKTARFEGSAELGWGRGARGQGQRADSEGDSERHPRC
jgi:hypothetical protein